MSRAAPVHRSLPALGLCLLLSLAIGCGDEDADGPSDGDAAADEDTGPAQGGDGDGNAGDGDSDADGGATSSDADAGIASCQDLDDGGRFPSCPACEATECVTYRQQGQQSNTCLCRSDADCPCGLICGCLEVAPSIPVCSVCVAE